MICALCPCIIVAKDKAAVLIADGKRYAICQTCKKLLLENMRERARR